MCMYIYIYIHAYIYVYIYIYIYIYHDPQRPWKRKVLLDDLYLKGQILKTWFSQFQISTSQFATLKGNINYNKTLSINSCNHINPTNWWANAIPLVVAIPQIFAHFGSTWFGDLCLQSNSCPHAQSGLDKRRGFEENSSYDHLTYCDRFRYR